MTVLDPVFANNRLLSTVASEIGFRPNTLFQRVGPVPTHPSTNPVDQPIDLFVNGPAHTTFLHVGISAGPVAPLVNLLFNRPQDNYARESRT
jgi:hypothetical protein